MFRVTGMFGWGCYKYIPSVYAGYAACVNAYLDHPTVDAIMLDPFQPLAILAPLVARAHRAGLLVGAYTTPRDIAGLASIGFDFATEDEQLTSGTSWLTIPVFNEMGAAAKAINPNFMWGMTEPSLSTVQSAINAGAHPDFIAGEYYGGSSPSDIASWISLADSIGAKAAVWLDYTSQQYGCQALTAGGSLLYFDSYYAPQNALYNVPSAVAACYQSGSLFHSVIDTYYGIYEAKIPPVQDGTLWGRVRVLDVEGQETWSDPVPLYNVMTPNPSSTHLSLNASVLDVEPKSMNLTLVSNAAFYNAVWPYGSNFTLEDPYQGIAMRLNPSSRFAFSSGNQKVTVSYGHFQLGYPELFPFDQYNYTLNMVVPDHLNASNISFNGNNLQANAVYTRIVPLQSANFSNASDDSSWQMQWQVQYRSQGDPTMGTHPYLKITIILNRPPKQVNSLLIPTLFLFALLGSSVMLGGPNKIRNRLILCLGVLVSACGFCVVLWIMSVTLGLGELSIIERVGLALIACVGILASCIILGGQVGGRVRGRDGKLFWERAFDLVGVFASAWVLYSVSVTTVTELMSHSPWVEHSSFTILRLGWSGWFGPLLFIVLLFPTVALTCLDTISHKQRCERK
jgi:hypothetical protein